MEFGPVPTQEAAGAILAHAVRTNTGRIPKGQRLDQQHLKEIADAGLTTVTVARLTSDDLDENAAAAAIAAALTGATLRAGNAGNGRCNLYARQAGLVIVQEAAVTDANLINEALTVATLQPGSGVSQNQLVATIKVITFGVARRDVDAVTQAVNGVVHLAPYAAKSAALIQTRLPHTTDALLEKTARSTRARLQRVSATLRHETVVGHSVPDLASALKISVQHVDIIAIIGASAIADRRDIVPAAIEAIGGTVIHFGLPIDPGNLTLLGDIDGVPVVAMPGSARSPRAQGSDWLLERLAAGLPIEKTAIAALGVGGLLKEIRSRPMPREPLEAVDTPERSAVDAILLAAGQSARMGARNKLLEPIEGQPMIRRIAEQALDAGIRRLVVVTGHQAPAIRDALAGLDVSFVHNAGYATGMASSVVEGIQAVAEPPEGTPIADAALVLLGDMPDVGTDTINRLIENYDPARERRIIAAAHQGQRGNPVLWDAAYFDDLLSLDGDKGARDVLREHADSIIAVDLDTPGVLHDLDTPAAFDDYRDAGDRNATGGTTR